MLTKEFIGCGFHLLLIGALATSQLGCSSNAKNGLKSRVTTINLVIPSHFYGGIVLKEGPAKLQASDSPMSFTIKIQKNGYGFHPYFAGIEHKEFRVGKTEFEDGSGIRYDVTRDQPTMVLLREGRFVNGALSFFVGTEEDWRLWIVDGKATGRITKRGERNRK